VFRRSLSAPVSALLSGLLAWCCVGGLESSAASKLDGLSWAADGDHAVLCPVTRAHTTPAAPSPSRRADRLLAAGIDFSRLNLQPSPARFEGAAAAISSRAESYPAVRSSRGPPL